MISYCTSVDFGLVLSNLLKGKMVRVKRPNWSLKKWIVTLMLLSMKRKHPESKSVIVTFRWILDKKASTLRMER